MRSIRSLTTSIDRLKHRKLSRDQDTSVRTEPAWLGTQQTRSGNSVISDPTVGGRRIMKLPGDARSYAIAGTGRRVPRSHAPDGDGRRSTRSGPVAPAIDALFTSEAPE